MHEMLAASAWAEQWSASPGDVVRCRVELIHTAPCPAADGTASVWVDWLAAQCCGFCTRHSAAAAAEFTTQPNMPSALATSLPDETQAGVPGRTCFLASSPQVVAAGLQLEAGRPASFRVSVALPPQQLPPSFAGHAASYEYVLLLTLRTMAPPAGKGGNPSEWKRGPICRLRLPLRLVWVAGGAPSRCPAPADEPSGAAAAAAATAAAAAAAAAAEATFMSAAVAGAGAQPIWCGLSCEDAPPAACSGADGGADAGAGLQAEADTDEEETEEEEEGEEEEGEAAAAGDEVASRLPSSFDMQVDGLPLARVTLPRTTYRVGEVVRGRVRLLRPPPGRGAPGACEAVAVSLQLEEFEPRTATEQPAHVVGRKQVRTSYLLEFGFELALPHTLPPQLSTPELQLRWALLFQFDVGGGGGGTSAGAAPRRIPWRLPLRVQPAPRALATPATMATPPRSTLHVDLAQR